MVMNVFIFNKPWMLGYFVLGATGIFCLSGAFVTVHAGERAAVFDMFHGVEDHTLSEGTHLLTPIRERAVLYDVRTQTYTMSGTYDEGEKKGDDSVTALSADGQHVKIDLTVRYHLQPDEIWKLHDQIGQAYVEKIIRPTAQTVVRNVVSKYTVTQLYSAARGDIEKSMYDEMKGDISKYYVCVDELLLRNISFSDAFAQAIEQKQVALQDAERMKYVLQKEEAEKERKIIAATGEAEAIRRRAQALKENPLLVQYEYVQKLAPNVKAVIADQKMLINAGGLFDDNDKK
jgi:prohibitin 2